MSKILSTELGYARKARLAALPRDALRRDRVALKWQIQDMATVAHPRPRRTKNHSRWDLFVDNLLAQSGKNIALISALMGGGWVLASEFRGLHVAVARIDEKMQASADKMQDITKAVEQLGNRVGKLEDATAKMGTTLASTEARLTLPGASPAP